MTPAVRHARPAVTLVEVLVAIAILSVLIGLSIVGVQRAREAANYVSCQAHMKDLALAVRNYETTRGKMPPYASGRPGEMYGGWYMHLLPYLGYDGLYQDILSNQHTASAGGLQISTTGEYLTSARHAVFPELVCASDPSRHDVNGNNTTNYLANWYALSDGVAGTYRRAQRSNTLTNGLSNVVLLAEGYSDCNGLHRLALYSARFHNFGITQHGMPSDHESYAPKEYLMFQEKPSTASCDKWRTQTAHSMMPVALADGSVRGVSPSISPHTWKHLVRARDGGQPGHDW